MKLRLPLVPRAPKLPRPRLGMTLLGTLVVAATVLAPAAAATAAASGPTITINPLTVNVTNATYTPPLQFTAPLSVTLTGEGFTPSGTVLAEVLDVTANAYPNGDNHYLDASPNTTFCLPAPGGLSRGCYTIAGGRFTYAYSFFNTAYSPSNPVPAAYPPCGHLMRVRAFDYQQQLWSNALYYIACQTTPPP